MKRHHSLQIILVLITVTLLLGACSREDPIAENLAELELGDYPEGVVPQERIEQLESLVAERRSEMDEALQAAARTAGALRQLALEYVRMEFYGPALDAFEEAIRIEPVNAGLLFWAGAVSAQLAQSQGRVSERDRYLSMAERYYTRSIEIEPRQTSSLYGLAVLYHFEMERHVQALPVAERLVEVEPNHTQGLFLLARIQTTLGDVDNAVATYERILEVASDDTSREQARRNLELLTGGDS